VGNSKLQLIAILYLPLMLIAQGCAKNYAIDTTPVPSASSQSVTSTPTIPTPPTSPGSVQLSPLVNAVAWEDLYSPPGSPISADFDYNDFMTEFKIQQIADKNNNITDIYIDFYPRAVGAGYDHTLFLVLTGTKTTPSNNSASLPITKAMFKGSADVTLTYYDQNGNVIGQPTNPAYNQDIVVFPSTHAIFGPNASGSIDTVVPSNYVSGIPSNYVVPQRNARVHISLTSPSLNPAPASGSIDPSTFRVILHPIPTNYDIDIINVDPTNFAGATGNPWGFIIPTDWRWMDEGQVIDNGYPEFSEYRKFLMGQPATGDYMNWFNHPIQPASASVLYPSIPWTDFLPVIP
jgi:hypothetical protein